MNDTQKRLFTLLVKLVRKREELQSCLEIGDIDDPASLKKELVIISRMCHIVKQLFWLEVENHLDAHLFFLGARKGFKIVIEQE